MAYERDDRRYGAPSDRDRGYGQQPDRNRSYDAGQRDYRGERGSYGSYGYGRDDYRRNDDDRGFFERAGDEVRSWFGDDEAERRRREDARYDERNRSYGSGAYSDYAGSSAGYGRDRDQRSSYGARGSYGDRDNGSYGASSYDRNRSYGRDHGGHHDQNYGSWRDRQIQAFDQDYDEYRRENQSRFESEFGTWRQGRQTQRDSLKQVQEHQDVVGSDGAHVGKVDHVRGDHIQLAKNDQDAGGKHHRIPSSWVQSVEGDKVTLNKTAAQAKQQWQDDDRNSGGNGGLFGGRDDDRGNSNLNRSFSGTY